MKIFVYAYNKPEYLIPQLRCLKKFVKEEFDFVCIDNSKENRFTEQFVNLCQENNITYIRNKKPDHSLEGTSHYAALQWSFETIISNLEEIAVMIDHDNFPINSISIVESLDGHHMGGVSQSRGHVTYLSPALIVIDPAKLPKGKIPSFKGSLIEGEATDIGGELHYYFTENPSVKVKHFRCGQILPDNPILSDLGKKYGYFHTFDFMEEAFVHPRNGSNWARVEKKEYENRDKLIFELIERNLNK